MKKSVRLLAMLMTFAVFATMFSVGASARRYDYTQVEPGNYDSVGRPFLTHNQMGTLILDMVDEMLAEQQMYNTFGIDEGIIHYELIFDFTSIDKAIKSIKDLFGDGLIRFLLGTLGFAFGDLEKINSSSIANCPYRDDPNRPDYAILYPHITGFLGNNANILGKVVDGSLDMGIIDWATGIQELTGDIPAMIKEMAYDAFFEDSPVSTVSATSSLDSMIQEKLRQLFFGYTKPEGSEENVEDIEPLFPSLDPAYSNLSSTSMYTFIQQLLKAAIKDIGKPAIVDALYDLAEIEKTEEFPYGDPSATDFSVLGIALEFVGYTYDQELLQTPSLIIDGAVDYLFDVYLKRFFLLDDTGIYLTSEFTNLIDQFIELASSIIPMFSVYPGIGMKTDEEVALMSRGDKVAYLVRVVLMSFVDFANIPVTATSLRSVITYLLVNIAADVLPEIDYEGMINAGTIDPDEDGALTVLAGLLRYYLNANFPLDIPKGLDFDGTLNHILNYFVNNYGGLVYLPSNFNSMTVWQKLDHILFKDILQANWLPVEIANGATEAYGTGKGSISYELIFNRLLLGIIDFDLEKVASIFRTNTTDSAELKKPVTQVILTLVTRLVNGLFGNNQIISPAYTNFESLVTASGLRSIVTNFCSQLEVYDDVIFGALLPLFVNIGGLSVLPALSVWAPEDELEFVTLDDLQATLDSQVPKNMEGASYNDDGYLTFSSEDFVPLYKYYDYEYVRIEAERLVRNYKENPNRYTYYDIINANYRLQYYYDRLVLRSPTDYTQLEHEINRVLAQNYIKENHTLRSWEILQEALYFAEETWLDSMMYYSTSIKQSKVSEARHQLIYAEKMMKPYLPLADYSVFNSTVNTANGKRNLNWYYPDTVKVFRDALNKALAFPVNYDVDDQQLVDDMAENLQMAIDGLAYRPTIVYVDGSSTQLDEHNKFIYGLCSGAMSKDDYAAYITNVGSGTLNYEPTLNGYGTGSEVILRNYDDATEEYITVDTYKLIIYGDADGDAVISGSDALLVSLIVSGSLQTQNFTLEQQKAMDANHDGTIDALDYELIEKAAIGLKTVSQVL